LTKQTNESSHPRWWQRIDWSQVVLDLLLLIVGIKLAYIYSGQLDQMIESNRISREAVESVQRPFIDFKTINQVRSFYTVGKEKVHFWKLTLAFENSGNTTAARAVNIATRDILESEPDETRFQKTSRDFLSEQPIGPKALSFIKFHPILEKDLFGHELPDDPTSLIGYQVGNGKLKQFIWGWVAYNDGFKGTKTHLTEYCVQLTEVEATGMEAGRINGGIGFQQCKNHNCTDDYCPDYQAIIDALDAKKD
jgi:hypothetical protein